LRKYSDLELAWRLQIADLQGNGKKGIIAAVQFRDAEVEEKLRYFNNEGTLPWEVDIDPRLRKEHGLAFEPAWTINHILLVPEPPGQTIWAAVANSAGWGGGILRFDAEGRSAVRFANAGHVERLALTTVYGEQCLAFCGENNDFDRAFVALLGITDPLSYSVPGKRTVYRFANATEDHPRKVVLFPPSELITVRRKPYGHAANIRHYKDRIIVHIETGGEGAELLYHFTSDLEPVYVFPSGSHEFAHRFFERKRVLKHSWIDCPERKSPMKIRVWTANTDWITREVPWRDDPWRDD
jgi:hypothetical protein